MIIYNQRLVKFQGYNEGTFYVFRLTDIKQFIDTDYKDLEQVFSFRKNTKDMFLYEDRLRKGSYIILRKRDMLDIKKYADSLETYMQHDEVKKKFEKYNFVYNIDFTYINTIYVISPYIQERFIQTDDIKLLEKDEIKNEYMDRYIEITPFFKAFSEKKLYHNKKNGTYYLFCKATNGKSSFDFVFDLDTIKELFRKYKHPDYEDFDEDELKQTKENIVVQQEREDTQEIINKEFSGIMDKLSGLTKISKIKKEESEKEIDESSIKPK